MLWINCSIWCGVVSNGIIMEHVDVFTPPCRDEYLKSGGEEYWVEFGNMHPMWHIFDNKKNADPYVCKELLNLYNCKKKKKPERIMLLLLPWSSSSTFFLFCCVFAWELVWSELSRRTLPNQFPAPRGQFSLLFAFSTTSTHCWPVLPCLLLGSLSVWEPVCLQIGGFSSNKQFVCSFCEMIQSLNSLDPHLFQCCAGR